MHGNEAPSDWVRRWSHLIAPGSTVLDVACGAGRHLRWLRGLGHSVVGVDRSAEALAACEGLGELVLADIESGPWPFAGRQFGPVWSPTTWGRPRLPTWGRAGRPARPEFLLQPGELLTACTGLRTLAYEDGFQKNPDRFVQRITAVRELPPPGGPSRHLLPMWAS